MKLKLLKIINLILGLCVFLACALITREYLVWRHEPLVNRGTEAGKEGTIPAVGKEFRGYEIIGTRGLFGSSPLSLIEDMPTGTFTPQRPAGAVNLIGTVVGMPWGSYALFRDGQLRKEGVFRQGEDIFGLGILTKIEERRVIVNINGDGIVFELPENRREGATQLPRKEAMDGRGLPGGLAGGGAMASVSKKVGDAEWIIDQRALNKVLNNMDKVLTDARLLPYSDGGKVLGFRISEIKPDGIFNLIGLQNSDVLLKVNNFDIDSPEKGVKLLSGLKGESSLSLEILRNGQHKILRYDIR